MELAIAVNNLFDLAKDNTTAIGIAIYFAVGAYLTIKWLKSSKQ